MRFLRLLLLVSACSVCLAVDDSEFFPIATGNEWIMDATMTAPDGSVKKGTVRRKVGGPEKRHGRTYHRVTISIEKPLPPSSSTKLTRKDENGVYAIEARDPNSREQTEILLPLKVGQTWTKSLEQKAFTDTVLGIESVTIGKKTYANCFHIQTTSPDGSFTEDYWEAPGIGSIKSEMIYGDGTRISLALREFNPARE
jgi:hypothetical protein